MYDLLKNRILEKTGRIAITAKDFLEENSFKVPDEVREARLDICKQCDNLHKKSNICLMCGCHTPTKTYLVAASCPLKKWEKFTK